MNATRSSGFLQSGHFPTLAAALLYFDVSFMVWVLFGPLAPFVRETYHLTATQQGLLVAVPLLGGSLFRPILGALGDTIGGRRAGIVGLTLTIVPLLLAWKVAHSLGQLYAIGLLLGVAGASFAVALPLASGWYPPQYQGLAMGIAGAGNSGSLLATLFAPRLAQRFGWTTTFGLMLLPVIVVLAVFVLLAKDSPRRQPKSSWRDYVSVLREPDTLWFSFIYGLTFGGFVGFASFLTTFFYDQYHITKVRAGDMTTIVVLAGSLLRPVGGWLADRLGGFRLLLLLLLVVSGSLAAVSRLPPLTIAVQVLFVMFACLGMGNGAVFQIVPQRFGTRLGLVTGVVGAAGGLGGFFLPSMLGAVKDATGGYAAGLLLLAGLFSIGAVVLVRLGSTWSARWPAEVVARAGVFCYRGVVRRWFGAEAV